MKGLNPNTLQPYLDQTMEGDGFKIIAVNDTPSQARVPQIAREDKPKSLRDEFAIAALPVAWQRVGENPDGWHGIAAVAYLIADAMMGARLK